MSRPRSLAAGLQDSNLASWAAGARLYARSRTLTNVAVAALALSLVLAAITAASVHVPFAPETTLVDLVLMTPLVPALLFIPTLGVPLASMEEVAITRMRALRSWHAAVVLTVPAITALAGVGRPAVERETLLVNTMILVGSMLCASVLSDGALSWLLPVLICTACFFYGTSSSDGSVRAWAVLLQEPSIATVLLGGGCCLAGVGGFVVRGPRGSSTPRARWFPRQKGTT